MSPLVLALLFASAVLHAAWNLLLKKSEERLLATWLSLFVGATLFLPAWFFIAPMRREAWPFLVASALLEVAYFVSLTAAYRSGDFTVVYPLARGAVPALLALWSVLFLGERLSPLGLVGLAVLVAGLLSVGGAALTSRSGAHRPPQGAAVAWSLTVALVLSVLIAVDGRAVKLTPPFSFTLAVFWLAPLLATPFMVRLRGFSGLREVVRKERALILAIGPLSLVSYALALLAYSRSQLSYAGAIREVGIVLGALAGWRFLGEPLGPWRLAGVLLTFVGILLIAWAG